MSMYLLGSTPKGANASLLGEYKRTRRAKVYTFTSDPNTFLHYWRGRWWVGATPGKRSGYLFVEDDAATPDKITATWKVYAGVWLDAPNLRCVATSPLASAADEVFIVGKTPGGVNSGSLGKFVRGADLLNSRYVYRKVAGGNVSYLFYAIGSWWVGESLPRGSSAGGYVRMETDAWLPELVHAHGWLVASSQGGWLAAPDLRCVTSAPAPPDPWGDGKCIDASFPPEQSSLGSAAGWDAPAKVDCWLRAGALAGTDSDLFDGIGPGDLLQGSIGDCFLLASLACVAEHPELIESLFLEEQASDTGAYTLRLFSAEAGEWVSTTIDDTIPSSWNWGHPETLFAGSNATSPGASGEEWAMLLEKAVAKYCGSYGALVGGSSAWALQLLLGPSQPVQVFQRVDSRGLRWGAFRLERERLAASGAARSPGRVVLIGTPGDERGADEIWRGVLEALASRHVVTTGGVEKVAGQRTLEVRRRDELVTDHAYSVLRAVEAGGFRLLQLRNPWGNEVEWRGDWGDASPLWGRHPEVADAVGFNAAADGTFWIAYEQWADLFTSLSICSTVEAFAKARKEGSFAATRAARGSPQAASRGVNFLGRPARARMHISVVEAAKLTPCQPDVPDEAPQVEGAGGCSCLVQ